MNKLEKSCVKERILKLARLKSTGTPADLAFKFDISERSIKRIIKEMRDDGDMIRYDHTRMSYIREENE